MSGTRSWRGARIFTVGHSTRTLDELVAMLRAFGVFVLADIRTIPRSRHNPQFNGDALRPALRSRRLRYVHLTELGGLRRSREDSPNTGWRNASFRGFADYMLTEDFEAGLANPSTAARAALGQTVRQILSLDVDPGPLQRLAEAQRRLAPMALALRGMRPPRFAGLFEAFANVVPFQQVSLDAGVAIVGRLVEHFGKALEHEGRRFYAFPDARVVAEARLDALRACGLSLRKAETLRQVASAIESGEVTEEKLSRMSSAEAIRLLTDLQGIGPWSASLVLLRGMGRLDVFPPGDVGVARGLSRLTRLPPGPSLDRVIQRFGDRRGYLYFYSLGAALLAKNLIHAASRRFG